MKDSKLHAIVDIAIVIEGEELFKYFRLFNFIF